MKNNSPESDHFYTTIGGRIARRREELGWSCEFLGSKLNPPLTKTQIRRIEKGENRLLLHKALDIANALSMDLNSLTDGFNLRSVGQIQDEANLSEEERIAKRLMVEALQRMQSLPASDRLLVAQTIMSLVMNLGKRSQQEPAPPTK